MTTKRLRRTEDEIDMHQTCRLCLASHGRADSLCVPCHQLTDWFGSLSADQQRHHDRLMVEFAATLEVDLTIAPATAATRAQRRVSPHTLTARVPASEPRRAA
jgi:hypothetical protein